MQVHSRLLAKASIVWFVIACLVNVATAQPLKVVETNTTIIVQYESKAVVTYNKASPPAPRGIDSVYERSGCLHPVCSPRGQIVTEMFPIDHPHQHGVYSAWVKTTYNGRPVDFWNLAGGTGRVVHDRVVSTFDIWSRMPNPTQLGLLGNGRRGVAGDPPRLCRKRSLNGTRRRAARRSQHQQRPVTSPKVEIRKLQYP